MMQPSPSAASNSATSRVAANTSPTLTACTHTTCRPATAARNTAGTPPSRWPRPSRYRPLVSIRTSQYGDPTTKTASSSKLYRAINIVPDTSSLYHCVSEDHNQPCMPPHSNLLKSRTSRLIRASRTGATCLGNPASNQRTRRREKSAAAQGRQPNTLPTTRTPTKR